MKQSVSVDDLQPGMYVVLSSSWTGHPFLRNKFKLSSDKQIRKMREFGLREVVVDFDKSDVLPEQKTQSPSGKEQINASPVDPKDDRIPENWNPEELVSPELLDAIHDRRMAPEKKSQLVYHHSRDMMERLLEAPTAENVHTAKDAIRSLSDLVLADQETALAMLSISSHDFYTYTHSVNVGITSLLLAKAVFANSDAHDMQELAAGFFLHDLGKTRVDPDIINKPGRLTEDEMTSMRVHPDEGYNILKEADAMSEECRIIVMQHHEAFDGRGYPKQISGEEIHIYGRICGIADVYDALTAERSYKKAMTPFDALTLMRDKMPDKFDKQLFNQFVSIFQ